MGTLNIASWGLVIGAFGQLFSFTDLFPHVSNKFVGAILLFPGLTVFILSFCNAPPPISPRSFRWCLIVAMLWYALAAILVEVLRIFVPVAPRGHDPVIAARVIIGARVIMYLGALSFIVFIRACVILRRHETNAA